MSRPRPRTRKPGCGAWPPAWRETPAPRTFFFDSLLRLEREISASEGGYLRLPEYGTQLYAPPAGAATVFSCSLLHFVTPVTRGRRFVVVGFFWGESEQETFENSHAEMFPEGTDINRIA